MKVMTWFGTMLVIDKRTEWLAQDQVEASEDRNLVELIALDKEDSIWRFGSVISMPRALPKVAIQRPSTHGVNLLCVESDTKASLRWHYVSADPHGNIEVNRAQCSEWERFFLLSNEDYNTILRLLTGHVIAVDRQSPEPLRLAPGFNISTSVGPISLTAILSELDFSGGRSLTMPARGHNLEMIPK